MIQKYVKITKPEHVFKGFASTYNFGSLSSCNLGLQFKDTDSAIKSKLIELFTQLKYFKFVTTLVLVFKKIESEDKTKHDNFIKAEKLNQLSMKVTLMMFFSQSILQL